MSIFKSNGVCSHCGEMDYRNAKLQKMLGWLVQRLLSDYARKLRDGKSIGDTDFSDIIRENCELDSWWKDNERAYKAKIQREQEEKEKKEKIQLALQKLSAEERTLLKV